MGLGKTLQSICIVAGDHYDRQQKYKVSTYILLEKCPYNWWKNFLSCILYIMSGLL